MAVPVACCGPPIQASEGDLNQDGVVNLVDDTIMRPDAGGAASPLALSM